MWGRRIFVNFRLGEAYEFVLLHGILALTYKDFEDFEYISIITRLSLEVEVKEPSLRLHLFINEFIFVFNFSNN